LGFLNFCYRSSCCVFVVLCFFVGICATHAAKRCVSDDVNDPVHIYNGSVLKNSDIKTVCLESKKRSLTIELILAPDHFFQVVQDQDEHQVGHYQFFFSRQDHRYGFEGFDINFDKKVDHHLWKGKSFQYLIETTYFWGARRKRVFEGVYFFRHNDLSPGYHYNGSWWRSSAMKFQFCIKSIEGDLGHCNSSRNLRSSKFNYLKVEVKNPYGYFCQNVKGPCKLSMVVGTSLTSNIAFSDPEGDDLFHHSNIIIPQK
jgi:hypothetical protein